MRAKITKAVELFPPSDGPARTISVDDVSGLVPEMELEDGRVVEAYNCHRYITLGTEGEATYDDSSRIWTFAPDTDA